MSENHDPDAPEAGLFFDALKENAPINVVGFDIPEPHSWVDYDPETLEQVRKHGVGIYTSHPEGGCMGVGDLTPADSMELIRKVRKKEAERLRREEKSRIDKILAAPVSEGAKLCALLVNGGHDAETIAVRLQAPPEVIEQFVSELEAWKKRGNSDGKNVGQEETETI